MTPNIISEHVELFFARQHDEHCIRYRAAMRNAQAEIGLKAFDEWVKNHFLKGARNV